MNFWLCYTLFINHKKIAWGGGKGVKLFKSIVEGLRHTA